MEAVYPNPFTHQQGRKKAEEKLPTLAPCDYIIENAIGKGVFGEVFMATHIETNTLVALKKINKNAEKFNLKFLLREIAAGQILKHEGIVQLKEYFETIHSVYLVFEILFGVDLCTYMGQNGYDPLPTAFVKKISKQIIDALCYCHQLGICHRDIKLDNIFILTDGKIKILDFGLNTGRIKKGEKSLEFVGSQEYAAPEILGRVKEGYDPFKADVFSTGVVIYSLLYGEFPFSPAERWRQIEAGKHPTIDWPPMYETDFLSKDLLSKMLEINPEKRISMEEASHHLWIHVPNTNDASKEITNMLQTVQICS